MRASRPNARSRARRRVEGAYRFGREAFEAGDGFPALSRRDAEFDGDAPVPFLDFGEAFAFAPRAGAAPWAFSRALRAAGTL
ncbi:MAG: hypothetical protein ACO38V_12475, partial [Phycisphaerales bacterium]